MNVSLPFIEQIRALPGGVWIAQQFEDLTAAITAGWTREHGADGTHLKVLTGSGSPQNTVAASVGTIYLRTDGGTSTTLYVKESGSQKTGWVAK